MLERTSAQSEYRQVVLQREQAEFDLLIYKQQLQQWLTTDTVFILPDAALSNSVLAIVDTSEVLGNPVLHLYEQNALLSEQVAKTQRSEYLPDMSLGYFNQQLEGVPGNTGFQVGVGVPLFFWTQHGKVQAAKIQTEIARAEYQDQLLSIT